MNEVTTSSTPDLNVVASSSAGALIMDVASMDSMFRMAEIMAGGRSTIPEHLRNNKGDCMAVVMQAVQWKMNPFAVAQKTHVVNGTLGYEAQLVNAVIQSSGVTTDRFSYEWYGAWDKIIGKTTVKQSPQVGKYGDANYKKASEYRVPAYSMADEDGLGIRVSATIRGESEPRVLDLMLVQASVRNSPLWATDPKQQLAYLAVKRWTRLYAPDVILGVYTPDEFEQSAQVSQQAARDMGKADVVQIDVQAYIDEAQRTTTDAAAAKYWRENNAPFVSQPEDHKRFKEAVVQHRVKLADALKAEAARTVDMASTEAKPMTDAEAEATDLARSPT